MAVNFDGFLNGIRGIRRHPLYPTLRALWRGLWMGLLLWAMCISTVSVFRGSYASYIGDLLPLWVRTLCELAFLGFELNTVLLTFAIFDRQAHDELLREMTEEHEPTANGKRPRLSLENLCEVAPLVLLFGLTNASHLFGGLSYLSAYGIPAWGARATLTLTVAIAALLLSRFARSEAVRFWEDIPRRVEKKAHFWSSRSKQRIGMLSKRRFFARTLGYWVIYFCVAAIVPAVIPVFKLTLEIGVLALVAIPAVPILIGAYALSYYLRALRKRRHFIKKMKQTVTSNRFRLGNVLHPWRSVFRDGKRDGYDVLLTAGKTVYACRIVASVRKSNSIYLSEDGTAERVFAVYTPTHRIVVRGHYAQGYSNASDSRDRELFRYVRSFDYRFDAPAGARKILIFNPVPIKVYHKETSHIGELDNGMTVGDYHVYTGGAFLRMLERSLHGDQ